MDLNIQQDVEIDYYQLTNECITMAATYFNYADKAREAKSVVSEKADMLKVIQAERNIAIREQCANEGKRVTEDIIKSMVQSDVEVVNAMKELREAEATYFRLSTALSALEIKKSELDNLVKLQCNSMYVDSPSKPTKDIKNESVSEYNRRTMTPLPN
jgi:hypothetical protein